MKYIFSFRNEAGDLLYFICKAKTVNDALSMFAIHVFHNRLKLSDFDFYYEVCNEKGRKCKRVFNFKLQRKFFDYYHIISIMDDVYGVEM